jgi:hypothetical protein
MRNAICWSAMLLFGLAMSCPTWSDESIPSEITVILEAGDREIAAIKQKAEKDVQAASEKRQSQLEQLQDKFAKAGKLDQAIAVRDKIRELKLGCTPTGDPGTLQQYYGHIGQVLYFELMGASGGKIHGTDIYTADSHLATAAVHCGALNYAEKGVVKVTILPGKASYEASDRNGVCSQSWSSNSLSYKVESTKVSNEKPTKK